MEGEGRGKGGEGRGGEERGAGKSVRGGQCMYWASPIDLDVESTSMGEGLVLQNDKEPRVCCINCGMCPCLCDGGVLWYTVVDGAFEH